MIAFILGLGIRLATFFASAGALFSVRNRSCGSVVAPPCCLPEGPRGREDVVPARGTGDLPQAIDYARDYRQTRADFGAEIKILPDLREQGPAPLAFHAAASEMPSVSRSGAARRALAPQTSHHSPLAQPTPCRSSPAVGARCGNPARRDLCGGHGNMHPYRDTCCI
jgi:hypothetical protein